MGGRALLLPAGAIALVPAFAAAVDLRSVRPSLLVAVLATVWISDSAAYFIGRRFGKRKLAPPISPGKTWEGVPGALPAVALYAPAWASLTGPAGVSLAPRRAPLRPAAILPALLGLALAGRIGGL